MPGLGRRPPGNLPSPFVVEIATTSKTENSLSTFARGGDK
jgi:hypothetical protein